MDASKKLEMAYKFCKLLKVECIKKELEEQLEGYTFKSIERSNGKWLACFEGPNEAYIILTISFDTLSITKNMNSRVERITIDENMLLTDRVIDKRQNGIVYSIIQKQFALSRRFDQIALTDLTEQRFTLTRERINSLLENVDFDNIKLTNLLLKLRMLESRVDLKPQSDFYSEFSTHMNYYFNLGWGREVKDSIYPTSTYLNGEDVSRIFVLDGPDKLYRIYDLYNGIINPRNEHDINRIHLGLLSPDVFGFKELKGISEQEDSFVGASFVSASEAYVDYLKNYLDQRFGYKGNVGLDRNSILLGITYQMSWSERAKRNVERRLGIPYSEFERLDSREQQKLIEQKTGKKFESDHRLYIDGIPVDEDHIITREQLDRQIDEMASSGPKGFLKRFLRTFKQK